MCLKLHVNKSKIELDFHENVCSNGTKNSESLVLCLGLPLDGGFGVVLGFDLELQQRIGLIQSPEVII